MLKETVSLNVLGSVRREKVMRQLVPSAPLLRIFWEDSLRLCESLGRRFTLWSCILFGGDNCRYLFVRRGLKGALFYVIPSVHTPPSDYRFWDLLSHLKQIHKTDYADEESITFHFLLVQDAKMKLDENIIVGDMLGFSFITGMEWVMQWWGSQFLNQLRALPGSRGCAMCENHNIACLSYFIFMAPLTVWAP